MVRPRPSDAAILEFTQPHGEAVVAYAPAVAGALSKYVNAFVDGVDALLGELSGKEHRPECVLEACDLVSAILDADGRLTTTELEAWLDDIGPHLDPPVIITPQRLRESDLIVGKRAWLARPSTLFDLLVKADARDGARRANTYYELAMKLAHAGAAIDLVPSPDEIAAIDGFRTTLLTAMDAGRIARPGQPAAPAATAADARRSRSPNRNCHPSARSRICSPSSTG